MSFPLKQRILIRGCNAHIKAKLGCAGDYVADQDTLYSPFNGSLRSFYGQQGGNWLELTLDNGERIRMAHLERYIKKTGQVKEGEAIAITGNTGSISTGPHLHLECYGTDGKRLDPESYLWDNESMECTLDKIMVDGMTADKRIAALKDQVRTLQDRINSPTDGIAALTAQIKERDEILDKKRAEFTKLQEVIDHPTDGIAALRGEIITLKAQLEAVPPGITEQQKADLALMVRIRAAKVEYEAIDRELA